MVQIKKPDTLSNPDLIRLQKEVSDLILSNQYGKEDKIDLFNFLKTIDEEVEKRIKFFLRSLAGSHKDLVPNLKRDLSFEDKKFSLELKALERIPPELGVKVFYIGNNKELIFKSYDFYFN